MEGIDVQKKEKLLLILFTLAAGIIFDYLFYEKDPGISYPVYVLILLGLFWWSTRKTIAVKKDFGWFLLIPVFLLSAAFAIYSNPVLLALNFLLMPVLLASHTILASNNSLSWSDPSIIGHILRRALPLTFENLPKPFIFAAEQLKPKESGSGMLMVKKIAAGLLICVPILLIVLPLLSSADMVFNHYLVNFSWIWEFIDLRPAARHGLLVLMVFIYLYGYIWSFYVKPPRAVAGQASKKAVLDPVTVLTVLFVINLIYLLFSIIQFSYLYGGQSHVLPAGFTYAQYARRGFFELVAVAVINLSILLGSIKYSEKKSQGADRAVRCCLGFLVFFSLSMLFSAHFKMSLYEEACGLTYLRVFVHYFMAMLFVFFMIALGRVWFEKIPVIKAYIVIALAFYTVLNFINVDRIIVRGNIDRYVRTGEIDINYLRELSYDAIPDLLPIAEDSNQEVSRQVKEYLQLEKQRLSKDEPWQSFNYSRYQAKTALEKLESEN
jgi:hypothetical protein